MTKINRCSLALALTLFVLVLTAHAQAPSIEVSADTETVEFSAQGKTRRVHVEIFAPSGELVFETADSDGQSIRWAMTNQKGERVADGVYLATITVVDSLGKRRKRIEQLTVSSQQYEAQAASAPQESLAPTGGGTAGKIAKWTSASALGNSIITEGAGRVGVNVAPSATLQVNGLQPAPLANNGTPAPVLLQTTGGKGGNTTAAGRVAGAGASISLVAGNGGDGPSGSTPGKGGSITLQPGSPGAVPGIGGKGGGNILLAPSGVGNVGVGTSNPLTPLHVVSANSTPPRLQSTGTTSFAAGWDFYHGTVGKGYVGVPGTGVGAPGPGEMLLYGGAGTKTSLWAGGNRAVTILTNGSVGIGTVPSAYVQLNVVAVGKTTAISGFNPSYYGVSGEGSTAGVLGNSNSGAGVHGNSKTGNGLSGESRTGSGVYGISFSTSGASSAAGIKGENNSGGWAGYFKGPVAIIGGCQGCTAAVSDRALKANISTVNPRTILDRLAALSIKSWSYKSDAPSVRHMGPMAQDFRSAFDLGADDKHIDLIDANGVTMASVQALYQLMLEKDGEIKQLRAQLTQQQAQLNQVRRAARRKRAARR
ncbi:MAG TPA: tail fiber domain-containing protein [Pyrinomonadaceae bacterium]|nr:tail fiber domain-containing protein [Pyrinomonadaceae bacterium]